jgi:hypothetical protein
MRERSGAFQRRHAMNEQTRQDSATVDSAIDRVVRDMTEVRVADAAVKRVMARIRGAGVETEAAEARPTASLWLPRMAWSAAALAAMIATGAALYLARGERIDNLPAPTTATVERADMPLPVEVSTLRPAQPRARAAQAQPASSKASTTRSAAGLAMGDRVAATSVVTGDDEKTSQAAAPPQPQHAQNVKLDIRITDAASDSSTAAAKPTSKNISLIVADREVGSIRSEGRPPTLPLLDVIARPEIVDGGRIKLRLTLNYRSGAPPTDAAAPQIKKDLVVLVNDGASAIISQSADAASDRRVTLEVKATIQK